VAHPPGPLGRWSLCRAAPCRQRVCGRRQKLRSHARQTWGSSIPISTLRACGRPRAPTADRRWRARAQLGLARVPGTAWFLTPRERRWLQQRQDSAAAAAAARSGPGLGAGRLMGAPARVCEACAHATPTVSHAPQSGLFAHSCTGQAAHAQHPWQWRGEEFLCTLWMARASSIDLSEDSAPQVLAWQAPRSEPLHPLRM